MSIPKCVFVGVCDLCFMKVSFVRWALGTESSVKLVLLHVPLTRLGQTDFCIDQILMDGEGLSGPYIDLLQDLFDPTKKGAITLIDLSPGPVVANQKKRHKIVVRKRMR